VHRGHMIQNLFPAANRGRVCCKARFLQRLAAGGVRVGWGVRAAFVTTLSALAEGGERWGHTMLVEKLEPKPKRLGRPPGPLSPAPGIRELRALDELYNNGPAEALTDENYVCIKTKIYARTAAYGRD